MKTKVFVSSTCYDLIDLRAELELHLKDLGLDPVLSESFTSDFEVLPSVNSIEGCLHNVRNCDIYIIIISSRYGPTLKKAGFQDVSATHLEYEEAVAKGKPIYMYARNRFEVEYSIFQKKNDTSLLRFVQKENCKKLFDLYKRHKTLSATKQGSNWVDHFENIVDLKLVLQRDFKKISGETTLKKMIENREAPILTITNAIVQKIPSSTRVLVILHFKNYGTTPALDPRIFINKTNLNGFPVKEVDFEEDGYGTCSTIGPNESMQVNLEYDFKNNIGALTQIAFASEIKYTTVRGYVISDISTTLFYFGHQDPNKKDHSSSSLSKHHLKKYYDSNGFEILSDLQN